MCEKKTLPERIKRIRTMLVDDDSFMLDLLEEQLRALGMTDIAQASDGRAALSLMDGTTQPMQLLICDLNMPGMDGIEFFRHLADRGFEGWMVITSGSDVKLLKTVANLVEAHQLNLLGVLHKPIEESSLVAVLEKIADVMPSNQSDRKLELLSAEEISEGLHAGYVEVFFQPQITVLDGRLEGAECLVRWRHPTKGIVPPVAFISVAEEHGLIDALTMEIFRKAMYYHGEWTRQGHALKISVNVSMDNLDRLDLPEQFAQITRQAGVSPRTVMLEMTESRLISNLAASLEVITRLSLMGFSLSVDDFGTGYSSMEKLNKLPFDELKVDQSFVSAAAGNTGARAILDLSVRMARTLDMRVVAEGVETQDDLDVVIAAGCDEVQGYLVARPMPADLFIQWKQDWEANRRSGWPQLNARSLGLG